MKSDLFILPTLPYGVQESRKTNADEKRRKTHMQLNRSMTRDVSEEILLPFPEDSTTKRALLILCPGRAVSGAPPPVFVHLAVPRGEDMRGKAAARPKSELLKELGQYAPPARRRPI